MSTAVAPESAAFTLPGDLSPEVVKGVVDAVAACYVGTALGDGGVLLDCVEPTVVAVTLAAQLFRVDEIDRVVVLCAKEATAFWADQFTDHTGLRAQTYYGNGRAARRAKCDPQVLVSTSDTIRPELAHRVRQPGSRSHGVWELCELGEELAGQRVLWIVEVLDRLDDRGLETYRGFEHFFTRARQRNHQRLVGLRFPGLARVGNAYDLGRLFCPSRMPSVKEFSTQYCFPMLTEQPVLRPECQDAFHRLFTGVIVS